jgi:hypothetical protein
MILFPEAGKFAQGLLPTNLLLTSAQKQLGKNQLSTHADC